MMVMMVVVVVEEEEEEEEKEESKFPSKLDSLFVYLSSSWTWGKFKNEL